MSENHPATTHGWISGDRRSCAIAFDRLSPDLAVDSHRRLRGPYTAAGTILRALVPDLAWQHPDLVTRHAIEILAVAPELDTFVEAPAGTLTSTAPREERTRWYSHLRTRRISHGLVDLLVAYGCHRRLTIAVAALDRADPTDVEFVELALRRLDPARIRLVVGAGSTYAPPELVRWCEPIAAADLVPAGSVPAGAVPVATVPMGAGPAGSVPAAVPVGAGPFEEPDPTPDAIAEDGTSDDPRAWAGYEALDPAERARRHDERAAVLEARGELSLRLGAIPYHRLRGATPSVVGWEALRFAVEYCMGAAFYEAGLELVEQLMARLGPGASPSARYWASTQKADFLVLLRRPEPAEPIYYDLLSTSTDPQVHLVISYALAMLYTRIHGPEQIDHHRARAHINTAIALADRIPDPAERAFHSVFMHNGKALVEMHLGHLDTALELVSTGIELLERELTPEQHRLHRSVLHHNRGQLYAALGRSEEALAEFDHVIEVDPHYPEYRFDRANLLSRLDRPAEALRDYEVAARLGPPFPELFYNIADLHARLGEVDEACQGMRRVLDLEPDHLDAAIGLASLLLDRGEPVEALAVTAAALGAHPDQARLHCTHGLALLDLDRGDEAGAAFDRALALDPTLTEALVNRAVVAFEAGQPDRAIADLSAALDRDPTNPDILYNRGYAYEAAGRPEAALADYDLALQQSTVDRETVERQRRAVHAAVG